MSSGYTQGTLVLERIQDAIYNWIQIQVEGVIEVDHIIWRQQSEPLPGRPCVTMKITDGPRPLGSTESEWVTTDKKLAIGGQRVMTVSIQVFGNTKIHRPMAYQLACDLNDSLNRETVRQELNAAGIGVQKRGDPVNISALEETEYEERAQFDVVLCVAQNILDEPGTIEHVNIESAIGTDPSIISV